MEGLMAMIFGGGATGLLGTIFSRVFDFVDKYQDRQFILAKYRLDAELRAKEMESEERVAEIKGYSDTLAASYLHDTGAGTGSQWVIDILRLVRPVITLMLWILMGLIWFSIVQDIKHAHDLPWLAQESITLKSQIVGTVAYCATAATLWWFGTRDMRKGKL